MFVINKHYIEQDVKKYEKIYYQSDCIYYGFDLFSNFSRCYDCIYFFRKVVIAFYGKNNKFLYFSSSSFDCA